MGYREREGDSGGLSADCRGYELRDRDGEKIGKVDEVFVDADDRPEYLGVKAGILGGKLSLIPAELASADEERRLVEISESKDRVKDAPSLGSNEEIGAEREREVRDYFGLGSTAASASSESDTSPDYRADAAGSGSPRREDPAPEETSDRSGEYEAAENERSEEREPWSGSRAEGSTRDVGESSSAAERGPEDTGGATSRDTGERREPGRESSSEGGANQETVRVTVWRERARAERVAGDDGGEEVRIRKEWVEEEEIVEVEGGPRDRRSRDR